MIKAIVADVDGVIVGKQPGVNFPLPHRDVIKKLHDVHNQGIPVILCTAKFGFSIMEIIHDAKLANPHITDGGALVIDPIDNLVITKHVIDKTVVRQAVTQCLEKGIHLELYTPEAYYMQRSQVSDFLPTRIKVLQKDPVIVDSLASIAEQQDIIKMIVFAHKDDLSKTDEIVKDWLGQVSFIWSSNPYLEPMRPGILTAPNVSKVRAVREALQSLGISFSDVLGVGDTASDWNFMEPCGYVATLANGDNQIKQLVKTKSAAFVAPSVDENGFLDIVDYFFR